MRCSIVALLVVSATFTASAQQSATYTHDKTGVVFTAPEEWTYVQTVHLLDGGDQIQWRVRPSGAIVYAWIIAEESDAAAIEQRLNAAVDRKIAQRRSANYRNYDIRRDTIRRIVVDGRPALSAIARFDVGRDGHADEPVAWIMSPHAHVFVFAPTTSEQTWQTLQPQFERFLTSIQFP